jgi:ligand-binding sensor domain-containing protein/AraC-like DNA-binding protein
MLQARNSFIWIGTKSGLVRFDGVTFRTYNRWNSKWLKNDSILSLAEDNDGFIWIGTDGGGISKLQDSNWDIYSTSQGLSDNIIRAIVIDPKNNVWIGTANGLNRLKEGKITIYDTGIDDLGNSITSMISKSGGGLWIGTDGNGLYHIDKNGAYETFTLEDSLSSNEITALCEDKSGHLWVGTEKGLNRLKNLKTKSVNQNTLYLKGHTIRTIKEDTSGIIWIGTDGDGLYQFNKGHLSYFPAEYFISNDYIFSFLQDFESNIWIGTYTNGLIRMTPSRIKSLPVDKLMPNSLINLLIEDNTGYLLLGTDRNGVIRINPQGSIIEKFLPGARIRSLHQDKQGSFWIGTLKNGLARIGREDTILYTTREGLSSNEITCIFEDGSGNIWIGTSNGINKFYHGEFIVFSKKSLSADPGSFIRSVTEGVNGKLWIATKGGLKHFQDKDLKDYSFSGGKKIEFDILSLYADKKGNLWMGTNGNGLALLKNDSLTLFNRDSGISSNYILSILEDDMENLWMSSYTGVLRISKNNCLDYSNKKSQAITSISFNDQDGMKNSECLYGGQPAAIKTSKGELYFPTLKGVAIFNPATIKLNHIPPQVFIEEIYINNEQVKNKKRLTFSAGEKIIEFYFTAVGFRAPEKVKIQYMLEGFNSQWLSIKPRQKRAALYVNLKAGKYIFRVRACNSDGVWNSKEANFHFNIKTQLYNTPLFYVIFGIILVGISLFTYSWINRKKNLAKNEKKYKTSALLQERVDEILPKLQKLMDEEKIYLNADLTLNKLSQQLHVHYNHLSQIVNEHLNQSFNDFINSYRIEEAKRRIKDPKEAGKTILEIAYDTGFYSKSVFNTAFKKFTGITPSQFKKENK